MSQPADLPLNPMATIESNNLNGELPVPVVSTVATHDAQPVIMKVYVPRYVCAHCGFVFTFHSTGTVYCPECHRGNIIGNRNRTFSAMFLSAGFVFIVGAIFVGAGTDGMDGMDGKYSNLSFGAILLGIIFMLISVCCDCTSAKKPKPYYGD